MKFDLRKAFPHPVLRPGSNDYPDADFEAEIDIRRKRGMTHVHLSVVFSLSEDDLLKLIEQDAACFVLVLECSTTHLRAAFRTTSTTLEQTFQPGQLRGLVELRPFVVATRTNVAFQADGWHEDFADMPPLTLFPGTVLAADEPKDYYIDNAEEAPIGSIFTTAPLATAHDGTWSCNLNDEKVEIQLSPEDHERLTAARKLLDGKSDAAYLMNGLFLPALLHVLVEADANLGDYEGRRWFRSLNAKLTERNLEPLGASSANRLAHAQRLLEHPFSSMPCLNDEVAK